MKNLKLYLFFLSTAILSLTSCSKDENNNGPEVPEYVQPSIAEREVVIEAPEGLVQLSENGDIYATMALGYFNLANTMANYASYFAIPADVDPQQLNNGGALYSWSHGGYSYWMTFQEQENKYIWKYEYELPGFPRFTYIQAEESKNGNSGSWNIYNPDSPDEEIWTYNWNFDVDGNFSATLNYNEEEDENEVFAVASNNDGSGSFIYTVDGTNEAEIDWNDDGSGNYWFNNSGDEVTNSWPAQ